MLAIPLFALLSGPPPPDAPAAFRALLAEEWETRLAEDPLLATSVGDHRFDDRLPAATKADFAKSVERTKALLARLRAIDPARLAEDDRISHEMLERELREGIESWEFGEWRLPVNADSGFHTELARLAELHPFRDAHDYETYLSRLAAVPGYVAAHVDRMREGLRDGFTAPRAVLDGYDGTIRAHVVEDPETSAFYKPFMSFPAGVPEADRERLRGRGRDAARVAVGAYRDFLAFFTNDYLPGCRKTTAASDLPNGRAYYAWLVKRHTTLDVTPEDVHRTGLAEVARIRAEMDVVIRRSGFTGDFAAFLAFLRTDPRFYAKTPAELLKEASFLAKKIDGRLPAFFGTLPRLPYGVEPVPDDIAPKYTGGRYVEAPTGGTRAGTYWVNTYNLASRPLYVLPSLTLHEAVPGHHLQIALQHELTGLPPFRRSSGVTAYVEGWALYGEHLGVEMGMYADPYADFGRLTYEMWRACRLVVDTGLHAMGWSPEKARTFLASNTALSLHEVGTETDRYVSWPGQALAYKMGELKIRALRAKAEKELGTRFDLRAFHDTILASGPVPLGVLERRIEAFIAARRQKS